MLLLCALNSYSLQSDTCKVLVKEISGTYIGGCVNGLAHGKGTATGEDVYTGEFKNGLPDGKGKYTYKGGNIFSGNWIMGVKSGPGKFTYSAGGKTITLKGYWVNGEYVGTSSPDELYRVTNHSGIENYEIKKTDGKEVKVTITFIRLMQKYVPPDLKITNSTGLLSQDFNKFSIYDYFCPSTFNIYFTVKNNAGDARQCFFFFDILQPGSYEVTITDD
jgi:hypothetical protein